MLTGISMESLLEALEQVPPHTLKSMELLRRLRTEGIMPTSDEQSDAIKEQIEYSRQCERLTNQMRDLKPTPLLLPELSETFPL